MDRAPSLPVITSCEGCGACCQVVTLPPFRCGFDEHEDAWERLKWDCPELCAELLARERALKMDGAPLFGSPCLWYDAARCACMHYEFRPRACREFAMDGQDCHDARRRAGLDRR
jgi:uncharacterized protein